MPVKCLGWGLVLIAPNCPLLDISEKPRPHFTDEETKAEIQTSLPSPQGSRPVEKNGHPGYSRMCFWQGRVGAILAGLTRELSCSVRQDVPSPLPHPHSGTTQVHAQACPAHNQLSQAKAKAQRQGRQGKTGRAKATLMVPPSLPRNQLVIPGAAGKEKTSLFSSRSSLAGVDFGFLSRLGRGLTSGASGWGRERRFQPGREVVGFVEVPTASP